MAQTLWSVSWTGPAVPLRDLALHLLLLDEVCREALREAKRSRSDPQSADEAAVLVRLALHTLSLRRFAACVAAAARSANPFVEFSLATAVPTGPATHPMLSCNGPDTLLVQAAICLGATVSGGAIAFNTASFTELRARFHR